MYNGTIAKGHDVEDETYWEADDDLREEHDDVLADAQALAGVGWGTDEDHGFYGGDDCD